MAKCNECGCQLQGNESVCPQCGCPVGVKTNSASKMNPEVLERGKSTECEAAVFKLSSRLYWWGRVLCFVIFLIMFFMVIYGSSQMMNYDKNIGMMYLIFGVALVAILFLVTWLIIKLSWALMNVSANTSTTLKNIEIILESKLK